MSITDPLTSERKLPVAGTYNLRETGGYRAGPAKTRWGKLYRSDALHSLTLTGRESISDLGVRLIVDLRSAGEIEREPTLLLKHHSQLVRIVRVPIFPETSETTEPSGEINLAQIYDHMVVDLGTALARAVGLIADSGEDPVLVHCTAGKDRTGIVIALTLLAVGVSREDVIDDYTRTEANLAGEWTERMLAGIAAHGYAPTPEVVELVSASPAWAIERVIDRIEREWGSAEQYLLAHGLTPRQLRTLRTTLTAPPAHTTARLAAGTEPQQ